MSRKSRLSIAISALVLTLTAAPAALYAANNGSADASSTRTPGVDAQALQRAEAKFAHALAIANQFQAQAKAAGTVGDTWRFDMIANLMQGSEDNFNQVAQARSLTDAMNAALAVSRQGPTSAPASAASARSGSATPDALGSTTTDLVYVPITPCRIVDTRASGTGVIAGGSVQTWNFYGSGNVGGGSCSVLNQIPPPVIPAAFAANVTVDETGLSGFAPAWLTVYPQGGSTSTSFLNYNPGEVVANAGIITLNQANSQFSVVPSAPARIIVDTYGVFIAPQPTALSCTTVTNTNSFLGVTAATCPAGEGLTGGGCHSTSLTDYTYEAYPSSGNTYTCGFWPTSGNTLGTVSSYAQCCSVPGRHYVIL